MPIHSGSFADAGHVYVHIRMGVIGEQVGGTAMDTACVGWLLSVRQPVGWLVGWLVGLVAWLPSWG